MGYKKLSKKRKWLLYIVIMIFLTAIYTNSNYFISKVNNIMIPLKTTIYKITTICFSSNITKKDVYEQNEILKSQLYSRKYLIVKNKELLKENERLRAILNIKKNTKYKMIIAQISYIDALNPYSTITIDKGENDGITKNMAVIVKEGVVGRIKKVYNNHSTVELITANSSYISAIDRDGQNLSVARGHGDDILSLEYVTSHSQIKNGDQIFTSGISSIYQKKIYIGKITSIKNNSKMFKLITVKLPYDIFNLKYVMVVQKEK